MFAVILGKPGEYRDKKRVFTRGFTIAEKSYRDGSYLEAELKSFSVDFKKLSSCLGGLSSHAVFSDGLILPSGCGIRPVDTGEIAYICLKNAVDYLLSSSAVPLRSRYATLIDLRGEYHDLARIMAHRLALLHVVTFYPKSYEHLSKQLLEEMGAVIDVVDCLVHPNESLVIVSPKGIDVDFKGEITVPFITLEPERFCGASVIHDFHGMDFSGYGVHLPESVNEMQLAAALGSADRHVEIRNILPQYCCFDRRNTEIGKLLL